MKVDLIAKKQSYKWSVVGAKDVDDIDMIFTLVKGVFGSLGVWTSGFNLEEQIHAEPVIIQRSSLMYLTEAAVGTGPYTLLDMSIIFGRVSTLI